MRRWRSQVAVAGTRSSLGLRTAAAVEHICAEETRSPVQVLLSRLLLVGMQVVEIRFQTKRKHGRATSVDQEVVAPQ